MKHFIVFELLFFIAFCKLHICFVEPDTIIKKKVIPSITNQSYATETVDNITATNIKPSISTRTTELTKKTSETTPVACVKHHREIFPNETYIDYVIKMDCWNFQYECCLGNKDMEMCDYFFLVIRHGNMNCDDQSGMDALYDRVWLNRRKRNAIKTSELKTLYNLLQLPITSEIGRCPVSTIEQQKDRITSVCDDIKCLISIKGKTVCYVDTPREYSAIRGESSCEGTIHSIGNDCGLQVLNNGTNNACPIGKCRISYNAYNDITFTNLEPNPVCLIDYTSNKKRRIEPFGSVKINNNEPKLVSHVNFRCGEYNFKDLLHSGYEKRCFERYKGDKLQTFLCKNATLIKDVLIVLVIMVLYYTTDKKRLHFIIAFVSAVALLLMWIAWTHYNFSLVWKTHVVIAVTAVLFPYINFYVCLVLNYITFVVAYLIVKVRVYFQKSICILCKSFKMSNHSHSIECLCMHLIVSGEEAHNCPFVQTSLDYDINKDYRKIRENDMQNQIKSDIFGLYNSDNAMSQCFNNEDVKLICPKTTTDLIHSRDSFRVSTIVNILVVILILCLATGDIALASHLNLYQLEDTIEIDKYNANEIINGTSLETNLITTSKKQHLDPYLILDKYMRVKFTNDNVTRFIQRRLNEEQLFYLALNVTINTYEDSTIICLITGDVLNECRQIPDQMYFPNIPGIFGELYGFSDSNYMKFPLFWKNLCDIFGVSCNINGGDYNMYLSVGDSGVTIKKSNIGIGIVKDLSNTLHKNISTATRLFNDYTLVHNGIYAVKGFTYSYPTNIMYTYDNWGTTKHCLNYKRTIDLNTLESINCLSHIVSDQKEFIFKNKNNTSKVKIITPKLQQLTYYNEMSLYDVVHSVTWDEFGQEYKEKIKEISSYKLTTSSGLLTKTPNTAANSRFDFKDNNFNRKRVTIYSKYITDVFNFKCRRCAKDRIKPYNGSLTVSNNNRDQTIDLLDIKKNIINPIMQTKCDYKFTTVHFITIGIAVCILIVILFIFVIEPIISYIRFRKMASGKISEKIANSDLNRNDITNNELIKTAIKLQRSGVKNLQSFSKFYSKTYIRKMSVFELLSALCATALAVTLLFPSVECQNRTYKDVITINRLPSTHIDIAENEYKWDEGTLHITSSTDLDDFRTYTFDTTLASGHGNKILLDDGNGNKYYVKIFVKKLSLNIAYHKLYDTYLPREGDTIDNLYTWYLTSTESLQNSNARIHTCKVCDSLFLGICQHYCECDQLHDGLWPGDYMCAKKLSDGLTAKGIKGFDPEKFKSTKITHRDDGTYTWIDPTLQEFHEFWDEEFNIDTLPCYTRGDCNTERHRPCATFRPDEYCGTCLINTDKLLTGDIPNSKRFTVGEVSNMDVDYEICVIINDRGTCTTMDRQVWGSIVISSYPLIGMSEGIFIPNKKISFQSNELKIDNFADIYYGDIAAWDGDSEMFGYPQVDTLNQKISENTYTFQEGDYMTTGYSCIKTTWEKIQNLDKMFVSIHEINKNKISLAQGSEQIGVSFSFLVDVRDYAKKDNNNDIDPYHGEDLKEWLFDWVARESQGCLDCERGMSVSFDYSSNIGTVGKITCIDKVRTPYVGIQDAKGTFVITIQASMLDQKCGITIDKSNKTYTIEFNVNSDSHGDNHDDSHKHDNYDNRTIDDDTHKNHTHWDADDNNNKWFNFGSFDDFFKGMFSSNIGKSIKRVLIIVIVIIILLVLIYFFGPCILSAVGQYRTKKALMMYQEPPIEPNNNYRVNKDMNLRRRYRDI